MGQMCWCNLNVSVNIALTMLVTALPAEILEYLRLNGKSQVEVKYFRYDEAKAFIHCWSMLIVGKHEYIQKVLGTALRPNKIWVANIGIKFGRTSFSCIYTLMYSSLCGGNNKNEMGAVYYNTQGQMKGVWRFLVGRPFERLRLRWICGMQINVQKIVCGILPGLIWLKIWTGGVLLWPWYWTCRFRKMREISWLDEDLMLSPDGLCPMKWATE
jgi:hypothetical protein